MALILTLISPLSKNFKYPPRLSSRGFVFARAPHGATVRYVPVAMTAGFVFSHNIIQASLIPY